MASSPSVDGGMTETQYKRLQMDERKWQAELEEQKYARSQEAEAKRLEMEKANEQKLQATANQEQNMLDAAQQNLSEEIDAQAFAQKEEDDDAVTLDFYGALNSGQELTRDRPE